MKIYYETSFSEIPENCLKCPCVWCQLPVSQKGHGDTIKKKYTSQRHEKCPLRVMEDAE